MEILAEATKTSVTKSSELNLTCSLKGRKFIINTILLCMPEPHTPPVFSRNLKAGAKTFYFDVRTSKNGKNYVAITELRTAADGQKVRNSLSIFQEQLAEFTQALEETVEKAKQ